MNYDPKQLPEELLNIPETEFRSLGQEDIHDEKFQTKPIGFYKDAMIRLSHDRLSMVSLAVLVLVILGALIVPNITGYSYVDQNIEAKYLPAKIPGLCKLGIFDGTMKLENRRLDTINDPTRYPNDCMIGIVAGTQYEVKGVRMGTVKVDAYKMCGLPDDEYHWFGTDYLGRDLLTRLFKGTRISLLIAFITVFINVFIGVIYGAVSAYYGGKLDIFLTHFAEVLDGLPYVVIVILFRLLFGSGMLSIILALCMTGWIGTSRLIRAQFYRFKGREYVLAARTLGVKDRVLIFRHILPNCVGPLITRAMISIPGAIFSESFLAYIGLGITPPETSIGLLLSDGQKVLLQYPGQVVWPAILISLLMIAFNLFANGLRDALDPTKRGEA